MKRLIVLAPGGDRLPLDEGMLLVAAERRWGDAVHPQTVMMTSPTLVLTVAPADGPSFAIDFPADGESLHVGGTDEQNAETAVWLRSLMPSDAPRIIAMDQGWSCHVELVPGITLDQFSEGVIDHSVPGWNANDPDGLY